MEGFGGAERDRTADLLVANEALSQLSYSPTVDLTILPRTPVWGNLGKRDAGVGIPTLDGTGWRAVAASGRVNWFNRKRSRLGAARRVLGIAASALVWAATGFRQGTTAEKGAVGIFDSQRDVGALNPAGTASFDAASGVYTVASAGWDLWAANDAFHMVWKKVSGDLSLTADIQVAKPQAESIPHRKAFLMFRQSLDPDSMYADAAVHGSGETSLQYRHAKGDTTQDLLIDPGAAKTVRLEKRGDTVTLFVSMNGEPLHQAGASIKAAFHGTFLRWPGGLRAS